MICLANGASLVFSPTPFFSCPSSFSAPSPFLNSLSSFRLAFTKILSIMWSLFPGVPFLPFLQDVNSVAVSPNDKLLASGSQDRTAKLWSLAGEGNVGLLGVFRGHRRGVWAVCFSPVDQVLATSSADGTTKLWSLQDFSCLKVGLHRGSPITQYDMWGRMLVVYVQKVPLLYQWKALIHTDTLTGHVVT